MKRTYYFCGPNAFYYILKGNTWSRITSIGQYWKSKNDSLFEVTVSTLYKQSVRKIARYWFIQNFAASPDKLTLKKNKYIKLEITLYDNWSTVLIWLMSLMSIILFSGKGFSTTQYRVQKTLLGCNMDCKISLVVYFNDPLFYWILMYEWANF